jgi:hypothetical protein
MLERVAARVVAVLRRLRRIERRELASVRRWLSNTGNLLHVSILLFVPLVLGLVTVLANAVNELSFLLFPPLASGTVTLFADPEGRYASPTRFVLGLTAGASCGWVAELVAVGVLPVTTGVNPLSAGLALFVTGAFTWAVDVEAPAAYSTALLVLVTDTASPVEYVVSVALSAAVVALAFAVWREQVYERRAEYLYRTTSSADHVLVPMRGPPTEALAVAHLGARLAAAHEAGKLVLLDVVDDRERALEERAALSAGDGRPSGAVDEPGEQSARIDDGDEEPTVDDGRVAVADELTRAELRGLEGVSESVRAAAGRLREDGALIEEEYGVPCELVVASGSSAAATIRTARESNCDLVVTPYEETDGLPSAYVRELFDGPLDVVALRTSGDRRDWRRVLVMVSRPGDSAHAMIDFAERLAGEAGSVSVCTCISREVERRPAENRLANLVETARHGVETRVARSSVESFLDASAEHYDLVMVGSSGDRSAVSRFVSRPTAQRLDPVDCDVAVVDRAEP